MSQNLVKSQKEVMTLRKNGIKLLKSTLENTGLPNNKNHSKDFTNSLLFLGHIT